MREEHSSKDADAPPETTSSIIGRFVMQLQGSIDMPAFLMAAHLTGVKLEVITKRYNNIYTDRFLKLAREALPPITVEHGCDPVDDDDVPPPLFIELDVLAEEIVDVARPCSMAARTWSAELLDAVEKQHLHYEVVVVGELDDDETSIRRRWCTDEFGTQAEFCVYANAAELRRRVTAGAILISTSDSVSSEMWEEAGGVSLRIDDSSDIERALPLIQRPSHNRDDDVGVENPDDALADSGTIETNGAGSATVVTALHDYFFRCRPDDANGKCPGDGAGLRQMSAYDFHRKVHKVTQGKKGREYTVPHTQSPQRQTFFRLYHEVFERVSAFTGSIPKRNDSKEEKAMFYVVVFVPYPPPKSTCTTLDAAALRESLLRKPDGNGYFASWLERYNAWPDAERLASDPLWYETAGGGADAVERWRHPVLVETWRIFDGEDRAARMRKELQRETTTVNERRNLISGLDPDVGAVLQDDDELAEVLVAATDDNITYDPTPKETKAKATADMALEHYERLTKSSLRASRSSGGGGFDETPVSLFAIDVNKTDDDVNAETAAHKQMHEDILFGGSREPRAAAVRSSASTGTPPSLAGLVFEFAHGPLRFTPGALRNFNVGALVPSGRLLPSPEMSDEERFLQELLELVVLNTCYGTQALTLMVRGKRFQAAKRARDDPDCDETETPKGLLLVGEPGCGKTHTQHVWNRHLELSGVKSEQAIGALCGQAALGVGGQTLHSLIGFQSEDRKRRRTSVKPRRMSQNAKARADARRLKRQQKWMHIVELTLEEMFAIQRNTFLTCSESLVKLRGQTNKDAFGGLLISGNGDPYQMSWAGMELFGPTLQETMRVRNASKLSEKKVRSTAGLELYYSIFGDGSDVFFADQNKRASSQDDESVILRFMLRLLRNGATMKYAEAIQQTLYKYCGVWNRTEEQRIASALAPVASFRHNRLDRVNNELHPALWAAKYKRPLLLIERYDELKDFKDDNGECRPVPGFLKNFINAHPDRLTQNDTQRMASAFPFIVGYEYSLWASVNSATGTVTHAPMFARGISLRLGVTPTLGLDGHYHVSARDVRSLEFELKHSAMGERCIPGLSANHFTLEPKTEPWCLDVEQIDSKWYSAMVRAGVRGLRPSYKIRSTGIQARSAAGKTMWCIQGTSLLELFVDLVPPSSGTVSGSAVLVVLSRTTSLRGMHLLQKFPIEILRKKPSMDLVDEVKRLRQLERSTIERHKSLIEHMVTRLGQVQEAMETMARCDVELAEAFVPRTNGDTRPLSPVERWRRAYAHLPSLVADLNNLLEGKAPSRECSICHAWSPQANIREQSLLKEKVLCQNCKELRDSERMPVPCAACKVLFVPASGGPRTRASSRSRHCRDCAVGASGAPPPSPPPSLPPSYETDDDGHEETTAPSRKRALPPQGVCAPHVMFDDTVASFMVSEVPLREHVALDAWLVWGQYSVQRLRVRALQNRGNTCFVNAALSALSFVPVFCQSVLAVPAATPTDTSQRLLEDVRAHLHWLHDTGVDDAAHCRIADLAMTSADESQGGGLGFARGQQADAHEFIEALLRKLTDATALPIEVFEGHSAVTTQRTHRRQCRCRTVMTQPFRVLPLELPRASRRVSTSTIEDLLTHFAQKERLGRNDWVECEAHTGLHPATRQYLVARAPRVLTLLIKRFGADGSKDPRHVELSPQLDLTPFMFGSSSAVSGRHVYSLSSVIVHAGGRTVHSGHYYTYVRTPQGHWSLSDCSRRDRVSLRVPEADVLAEQAYVAVYTHLPPSRAPKRPRTSARHGRGRGPRGRPTINL